MPKNKRKETDIVTEEGDSICSPNGQKIVTKEIQSSISDQLVIWR